MKQITLDITSETPELTFANVGIPGPRGLVGPDGKPFTYADFSQQQLADLKGEKGEAFTFYDFTPEQLLAIKGDKGDSIKGDKGDKGDEGDKGDALTYAELTDDDKTDLRDPLRVHFDTELANATQAATDAESARDSALQAKTDSAATLAANKAIQTDIVDKQKDVTAAATSVNTNAQAVQSNAQLIEAQVQQTASDASNAAIAKTDAQSASASANSAATTAVNAKNTAVAAKNDAQSAQSAAALDKASVEADRSAVESAHSDVLSKASTVNSQYDTVNTKAGIVNTQASQVSSHASQVASDKTATTTAKNDAVSAKNEAVVAKDLAQSAASSAQAALVYEGTWDASTGAYPVHTARNGIWKVSKAGTVSGTAYKVGEDLIWNNSANNWEHITSGVLVTSVNAKVGDVVLTAADVGALPANTPLFSGAYNSLTGVPATFAPSAHRHPWSQLDSIPAQASRWPTYAEVSGKPSLFSGSYADLTNKPASFPPSSHSHTYASLTGKPTLFSGKYTDLTGIPSSFPPSTHSHSWSSITSKPVYATRWPSWGEVSGKPSIFSGNYGDLNGIPATFAPSSHGHSWGQISGKPTYATRWPTLAELGVRSNAQNDAVFLSKTSKAADANRLDGLDSTSYMRDNGWNTSPGQDADTQPNMSSDFTYANNAPYNGPLWRMGSNSYDLQMNAAYYGSGQFSIRTYNGDAKTWNPWEHVYTDHYKPTAADVGAEAIGTSYPKAESDAKYQQLESCSIPAPLGGYFNGGGDLTGAIKVKLPRNWSSTMLSFTVNIYQYRQNESLQLRVGGYNYTGSGGQWINTSAHIISGDTSLPVRFGHDGTTCCIYIGESNTIWHAPKVTVTDFLGGASNFYVNQWADGWNVNVSNNLQNVNSTVQARAAYNSNNKPSPADIGALPVGGTAYNTDRLNGRASTESATGNSIVRRDGAADISARLFKSSHATQTSAAAGAGICFRTTSASSDNYLRFLDKTGMHNWLGRVKDSTRLLGKTLDQVKSESRAGLISDTRTVNNKRLNANITITKADVQLGNVPNYGSTNSYAGTSTTLLATQKATYDAAAAPRLEKDRKRKITSGTAEPTGGVDGDIYIQY